MFPGELSSGWMPGHTGGGMTVSGKSVLLLGVGMQGRVALHDLVQSPLVAEVVAVDANPQARGLVEDQPGGKARFVCLDASDREKVAGLMRRSDVVVELLPGSLAFPTAALAASTGVSLISSMYLYQPRGDSGPEDREFEHRLGLLDAEAKNKGITILPEFGLDPGIDLVCGMEAIRQLDEVHELLTYGAGIPQWVDASNPLRYKFSWSVAGLLNSYARPAQVIRGGKPVQIPADRLFSPSHTHHLRLDALEEPVECFANGDAVHYARMFGITHTVKEAGRYTCRWAGHCAFWEKMAGAGFLSEAPVVTPSGPVKPLEFVAALLSSQEQFNYGPTERDMALVVVVARGIKHGRPLEITYQLIDRRDPATGFSAMSRTVGFPMSVGAQMILSGQIARHGVITPMEVPVAPLLGELKRRGLDIRHSVAGWSGPVTH
ncbi:MAG TPA: saccharopine dehydrogenase [Clostridiales bacterium UBA8153]|nr:saccharopine dehydrogenase [Clostridiales bacterium UBA8153]